MDFRHTGVVGVLVAVEGRKLTATTGVIVFLRDALIFAPGIQQSFAALARIVTTTKPIFETSLLLTIPLRRMRLYARPRTCFMRLI